MINVTTCFDNLNFARYPLLVEDNRTMPTKLGKRELLQ